jgi:uncharacterized cupin superfamily protein
MAGGQKPILGDLFVLKTFCVNLTRLASNAVSALRHAHTKHDEFVYVLQGTPTRRTDVSTTNRNADANSDHGLTDSLPAEATFSRADYCAV